MAILQGQTKLYGKVGPVVYRRFRGSVVVQAVPRRFKQTAASVEAGTEFGLCSSASKVIRDAFRTMFVHHDGGMINRMNSVVCRAVRASKTAVRGQRDLHDGDLCMLEGTEFNDNSKLAEIWKLKPVVSRNAQGHILVDIPETNIRKDLKKLSLNERSSVRIRVVAIAFDFKQEFYEYVGDQTIQDQTGTIATTRMQFTGPVPPGCMVLVGLVLQSCEYMSYGGYTIKNNADFCPAAIIGAFQSEGEAVQDRETRKRWYTQENRPNHFSIMTYCGNKLLKKLKEASPPLKTLKNAELHQQKRKRPANTTTGSKPPEEPSQNLTGKRIKF